MRTENQKCTSDESIIVNRHYMHMYTFYDYESQAYNIEVSTQSCMCMVIQKKTKSYFFLFDFAMMHDTLWCTCCVSVWSGIYLWYENSTILLDTDHLCCWMLGSANRVSNSPIGNALSDHLKILWCQNRWTCSLSFKRLTKTKLWHHKFYLWCLMNSKRRTGHPENFYPLSIDETCSFLASKEFWDGP
jgi:hypothetical protein